MEEEKTQPENHQIEPKEEALVTRDAAAADNVAAVAGAHDIHMQEAVAAEEADRQCLDAATASDEALAHALQMDELMEMNEAYLRARPSLRPVAQEVPAGAQEDLLAIFTAADAGAQATSEPEIDFIPRYDQSPPRGIIHETGTIQHNEPPPERTAFFLPRPIITATSPRAGTNVTVGEGTPPHDVAGPPSAPVHPSEVAASAGPTSSRHVPGDDVATLPSETTLPACVASPAACTSSATALAKRPIVPVDDAVSSKRRALLADADVPIIFASMEEGHDNGWYESFIGDDENLDLMEEDLGFRESLQQCLPSYEPPKDDEPDSITAAVTGEEGHEFSLEKFCNRWSISPSDLAPDEAGPSTKKQAKVPPLADNEVPKFDCGICMETLDVFDLFHGLLCNHKFCAACMNTYVEGRIREGSLPIPCPDPACKGEDDGILHPEKCKKGIDFAAFSDWGARLTERAVPADRRAYCPNRRCGIMVETSGERAPAMARCPACNLLLCAACGMEWSADGSGEHDCAKDPQAALVMKLAGERRWKRCPRCKMIVERIDGCNTMSCRCRFVFCYRCGHATTRAQVEEVGGEACRCNDTGLALAFAHQHQFHFLHGADMPPQQQQDDVVPPLDADVHHGLGF